MRQLVLSSIRFGLLRDWISREGYSIVMQGSNKNFIAVTNIRIAVIKILSVEIFGRTNVNMSTRNRGLLMVSANSSVDAVAVVVADSCKTPLDSKTLKIRSFFEAAACLS